jgi:hypothetical protein
MLLSCGDSCNCVSMRTLAGAPGLTHAAGGSVARRVAAEAIPAFIEKRRRRTRYPVLTGRCKFADPPPIFHLTALEWARVQKLPARISLISGERVGDSILGTHEGRETQP